MIQHHNNTNMLKKQYLFMPNLSKQQQCIQINKKTQKYKIYAIIQQLHLLVIGKLKIQSNSILSIKIKNQITKTKTYINQNVIQQIHLIQLTLQTYYRTIKFILQSNNNNGKQISLNNIVQNFVDTFKHLSQNVCNNNKYFVDYWKQQIQQNKSVQSKQNNNQQYQTSNNTNQLQQLQNKKSKPVNKNQPKKTKNNKKQIKSICQICFLTILIDDRGYLDSCKHIFHRQCLTQYILITLGNRIIDIKCPMENCKHKFSPNDIQMYIQNNDLRRYYELQQNYYVLTHNTNTIRCFTPSCKVIIEFNSQNTHYKCPACKKSYCLKCKEQSHKGISCKENQENKKTRHLQNEQKSKNCKEDSKYKCCPYCNTWIQKTEGCCSIKCNCGKQFCYNCGGTTCPHGNCQLNLRTRKG